MTWEFNKRRGTQKEWAFKSRGQIGQIVNTNPDNGTITVQLLGSREQYTVDIPSTLHLQGLTSSWQRYQPQRPLGQDLGGEFVEMAFDPRNRAFAVRPTIWPGPTDDSGAYAAARVAANNDPQGFGAAFRVVKDGEFDLRSKGGSGYYFNDVGHATIYGGPTAIELDARRIESRGRANLWVRTGDGTEVRYGDVKRIRNPQTEFVESRVVPSSSAIAQKEFIAHVGKALPVGADLMLAELHMGDLRGPRGDPLLQSGTGLPLRARTRYWGADGILETLSVEVDATGNVKVTQAATAVAGGISVSGTQVGVSTTVGNIGLTAQAEVQLAGAGGVASDGVVLGSALNTYLTSSLVVLTALGPSSPAVVPLIAGAEYSLSVKASV